MRGENMNSTGAVREASHAAPLPRIVSPSGRPRGNSLTFHIVAARAAFLWGALSFVAFGQATAGVVSGITRDSSTGKPVAEVEVTVRNLSQSADRVTVSNSDGVFTFADLAPGS